MSDAEFTRISKRIDEGFRYIAQMQSEHPDWFPLLSDATTPPRPVKGEGACGSQGSDDG